MKRVCFLGASTLEGLGDEDGLGWPGRLARLSRAAGQPIVAYNLGIHGQTLKQIAGRAVPECRPRLAPPDEGLIVLGTGANDLARVGGTPRTPRRRLLADFGALLESLSALAPLLVVGPFPICEARMPYLSQKSGLEFDFRNEDIAAVAADYGAIAGECEVPFLDLYPALLKDPRYLPALERGDGLHGDGSAYQVVADLVFGWTAWQRAV